MHKETVYPNIQRFQPQHCISGKMRRCNRIVSQIFRQYLQPFNITNSQLSILFIIAKKGTVTQSFLAQKLYLEKSTVSRNMQRLLKNGYLTKGSKQAILLTEKGKMLLEQIIPEWEKAMQAAKNSLKNEGEMALNSLLAHLIEQ